MGSTYADLKQSVRIVHYFRAPVGSRGRLPKTDTTLSAIGLPDDIKESIEASRQFAKDVTDGVIRVDGEGAANFIDSVMAVTARLFNWAVTENSAADEAPL